MSAVEVETTQAGARGELVARLRTVIEDVSGRDMGQAVELDDVVHLLEQAATGHLDPVTGIPWALLDRFGTLWLWGLDRQCQRWGYLSGGQGHVKTAAELDADTEPEYGLAPLQRIGWVPERGYVLPDGGR